MTSPNREKLLRELQNISPELKAELDYRMNDVGHEGEYDIVDAFEDAMDFADEQDAKLFNHIKQILISIGYVIPVDIKNVFSTGKKYWFIKGGVHYDCVCSWGQWIAEPKIIYNHFADLMGTVSTQEPRRVYDLQYVKDYDRFQAKLWTGGWTLHKTKDELLKSYPHIKIKDND